MNIPATLSIVVLGLTAMDCGSSNPVPSADAGMDVPAADRPVANDAPTDVGVDVAASDTGVDAQPVPPDIANNDSGIDVAPATPDITLVDVAPSDIASSDSTPSDTALSDIVQTDVALSDGHTVPADVILVSGLVCPVPSAASGCVACVEPDGGSSDCFACPPEIDGGFIVEC